MKLGLRLKKEGDRKGQRKNGRKRESEGERRESEGVQSGMRDGSEKKDLEEKGPSVAHGVLGAFGHGASRYAFLGLDAHR